MKLYYKLLAIAGMCASLASCNSFLDEMPDNRQELDRPDKIQALLVSAYGNIHHMGMLESRTDNVMDNGASYGSGHINDQEGYYWKDLTGEIFDSSKWYWDKNYNAIAHSNQALQAISELSNPKSASALRGEALITRAWAHFCLVNYFSLAYNAQTSKSDLGVPYITEPETKIGVVYPRLSVAEVYELIKKDLLEGLPLLNDAIYKTEASKYHFNKRAAYAFAAQFFLYYEDWQSAKEYATLALGSNYKSELRNWGKYKIYNTADETRNAFTSTSEPANLLIVNNNSLYGRRFTDLRYAHNAKIARQTYYSQGPWKGTFQGFSELTRNYTSYPDALIFVNRYNEAWQVTNKRTGVGIPYVLAMPLTVDKAILVRAEANVMLKLYSDAADDLSAYYISKAGKAATVDQITSFYDVPDNYQSLEDRQRTHYEELLEGICKPLNPKFVLEKGTQYNMIQAVLHARRLETIAEGDRWFDIKRYGIEITHMVHNGSPIKLTKDDPRRAMQLPYSVIASGLKANPR